MVISILVIFVSIALRTTNSERRIKDGIDIEGDVNYAAYLIKAPHAPVAYDAWICGGAIVHPEFIITSAACIEDVQFMYAIAGYKKYVNFNEVEKDECAKAARKKIVLSCVPKNYEFTYDKMEKWSFIDIGVVRVESPYDFSQTLALPACSWAPGKIDINYDPKYQQAGTDTLVMGWGHNEKWRKPGDTKDYNQPTLKYSPLLLQEKEECKQFYANVEGMDLVIDNYMICGSITGNIDAKGNMMVRTVPNADGCAQNFVRIGGQCQSTEFLKNLTMLPDDLSAPGLSPTPLKLNKVLPSLQPRPAVAPITKLPPLPPISPYKNMNVPKTVNTKADDDTTITFDDIAFHFRRTQTGKKMTNFSRRVGICQNDHGGPLVTWIGKNEVLIGVASVFRISQQLECIGPYLFTSTQCNGAFLNCVINNMTSTRRSAFCELPASEKGFDIVERRISWRHHPDGPAANELRDDLFHRPQYPLHSLINKSRF